jgi:hypothetical protein
MGDMTENKKEYIRIANRLAKPGTGSGKKVLRERGAAYGRIDISKHLGSVPFVVVGGLATRLYMPERMTLDIDVLVLRVDMEKAESELKRSGCRKTGDLTIGGSTWELPDNRSLDLIAPDEPWAKEAIETAVTDPDGTPCASLPYLVLMKLTSGRAQDVADISRMLGCAEEEALDATKEIVKRYRSQDLDDLESLIRLGKLEHEQE